MLTGYHSASSFFLVGLRFYMGVGKLVGVVPATNFQRREVCRDQSFGGSDFSFQILGSSKYSLEIASVLMNNDRLGEETSETTSPVLY